MKMSVRKLAVLAMLSSFAIVLGYVESLIPVFTTVPGMKLGLPNLAIIVVLYLYGWREAAGVSLVRILVIGLLFGNVFSVAYSLAGGALSLICMSLLRIKDPFGPIGTSMLGGIAHNIGQLIVAIVIVENVRVAYYFFLLGIAGLLAGALIGILGGTIEKRIHRVIKEGKK